MFNDDNFGFTKQRKYKKRSNIKQIILYAVLIVFSLYMKSLMLAGIFAALMVANIFLHIRNKDKIDSNLLSQGFYQLTHGEKKPDLQKRFEEEKKKSFQDYLQKIENDFDDEKLDEELYGDYADSYRENKE